MDKFNAILIGIIISITVISLMKYIMESRKFKKARKPKVGEIWTYVHLSTFHKVEVSSNSEVFLEKIDSILNTKTQVSMKEFIKNYKISINPKHNN